MDGKGSEGGQCSVVVRGSKRKREDKPGLRWLCGKRETEGGSQLGSGRRGIGSESVCVRAERRVNARSPSLAAI